jgi:hypothetical protein
MHTKNHLAPALEELGSLSGSGKMHEYHAKNVETVDLFQRAYVREAEGPVKDAVVKYFEDDEGMPRNVRQHAISETDESMKFASISFSEGGRAITVTYFDCFGDDVYKCMSPEKNHIVAAVPALHRFFSSHGVKRDVQVHSTSGYDASFDTGKPFESS